MRERQFHIFSAENWRYSFIDDVAHTILKASKGCFSVVLLMVLYKVTSTLEFVDRILKCDHSNESY